MNEIIATANDSGQRIDKFLSKRFKTMPTSLIYKYLRTKRIKINRKKVKESYIIVEGDVISLFIPDEFTGKKPAEPFLLLKPSLKVSYEDDNILVADKPAGLLVHSDDSEDTSTLINHIKAYLFAKGEYDPKKENSFAPALCNRIDRNTSGLVIAAKNAAALRELNVIIKNREVEKIYLAVCHGTFAQKSGELISFLEKDSAQNKVYAKKVRSKDTKTAVLTYRVVDYSPKSDLSLVEIVLKTGRTHQIRAQMAEHGHPLLGDGKYSVNKDDRKAGYSAQALCSYSLCFRFSEQKEKLQYLNGKTVYAAKPDFLKLF